MEKDVSRRAGRIATAVAVALLLAMPVVDSHTLLHADDYIKLTIRCPDLVVIRVKEVKEKSVGKEDAMEFFEVTVTGEVVEVVRGKHERKEFVHVAKEMRMLDRDAAKKAHGEGFVSLWSHTTPHRAADCKAGRRYLVLSPAINTDVFIEVKEGDETWREQIIDLDDGLRKGSEKEE